MVSLGLAWPSLYSLGFTWTVLVSCALTKHSCPKTSETHQCKQCVRKDDPCQVTASNLKQHDAGWAAPTLRALRREVASMLETQNCARVELHIDFLDTWTEHEYSNVMEPHTASHRITSIVENRTNPYNWMEPASLPQDLIDIYGPVSKNENEQMVQSQTF